MFIKQAVRSIGDADTVFTLRKGAGGIAFGPTHCPALRENEQASRGGNALGQLRARDEVRAEPYILTGLEPCTADDGVAVVIRFIAAETP